MLILCYSIVQLHTRSEPAVKLSLKPNSVKDF